MQPKCNFSTPYIFVLAFGLRTWRKDFMLKRGQKIGLTEGKALSLLSLFFLGDLAVAPARRCVKTWKEYSWSRRWRAGWCFCCCWTHPVRFFLAYIHKLLVFRHSWLKYCSNFSIFGVKVCTGSKYIFSWLYLEITFCSNGKYNKFVVLLQQTTWF